MIARSAERIELLPSERDEVAGAEGAPPLVVAAQDSDLDTVLQAY